MNIEINHHEPLVAGGVSSGKQRVVVMRSKDSEYAVMENGQRVLAALQATLRSDPKFKIQRHFFQKP